MSTIVRPPANFWRDLNDTRTRYAEQLVYDYLRGIKRWAVLQGWIELAIAVDVPMSEPEWWKEANDARQQAA